MTITGREITLEAHSDRVLSSIDLHVEDGQWVTIVGPNGAGKSTLLRCLAGLVAHSGEILLNEKPLLSLPARERARQLAYLPQIFEGGAGLTVEDFVMQGRAPHRSAFGGASEADHQAVRRAIEDMGLQRLAHRYLDSLSGGELQRARLAQVLVQGAPLLLLDEPTTALDIGHAQQLLELLEGLRKQRRHTIVVTMHDLSLAGHYGDRVMLLAKGRVIAGGRAEEVLTRAHLEEHYGASVEVISRNGRVAVVPLPHTED